MDRPGEASDEEGRFRVEALAARTGVPVRTIREYQTWQVLHPPTKVGRVGFYDESHVERLDGIARLQARGYSIAAIRDLFAAWEDGSGLRDVLGLGDSIASPADEAPRSLSAAQLDALIPAISGSTRLLSRAVEVGLIFAHEDRYVARSPALLQLVAEASEAGLPASDALDLAAAVVAAADGAGKAAAVAVADAARREGDLDGLVRRGRVLLARAVATHTIDRVGHHLGQRSDEVPALRALLDEVRIGTIVTTEEGKRP